MTDKWKKRLLLQGEFGWGFGIGFCPLLLFVLFLYLTGIGKFVGELPQIVSEHKQCIEKLNELQEASTILYEFKPEQGIDVLGGVLNLGPGEAIGGRDAFGRQTVRWHIPVKITPIVYGDGRGVAYAWVNIEQQKVEGPFVPSVQP